MCEFSMFEITLKSRIQHTAFYLLKDNQIFYLSNDLTSCERFSDRIVHFACGHVIPDENILPVVVTKGPTGKTLDFSFQFRDKKDTLDELGRALVIIKSNIRNLEESKTIDTQKLERGLFYLTVLNKFDFAFQRRMFLREKLDSNAKKFCFLLKKKIKIFLPFYLLNQVTTVKKLIL
jgi:hypothetical protein